MSEREEVLREFGVDELVRLLPMPVSESVSTLADEIVQLRSQLAAVTESRDTLREQRDALREQIQAVRDEPIGYVAYNEREDGSPSHGLFYGVPREGESLPKTYYQRAWVPVYATMYQKECLRAERMERLLRTATVRLGILHDRMTACDEGDWTDDGHALSREEIEAWIEEQNEALDAAEGSNA